MFNCEELHNKAKENWKNNHPEWLETDEDTFEELLECVPPRRQHKAAFMCGETFTYDSNNEPVFMACKREGGKYFGKLMTVREFNSEFCPELLHGVPHITKDANCYVYYKGKHVEHYSYRDEQAEENAAWHLYWKCRDLERLGIPVSQKDVGRN